MSGQTVTRFDYGRPIGVETTPEGFLRVDAYVARTGVQVYRDADGKERREYRPAAAVFDAASLESFHLKPVTLGHPTEGLLSAENAKQYQVGSIGETVKPERRFVRAKFLVTDGAAISAIKGGIRELSVGYQASFDPQPGTTDEGERYDGVQGDIRVNHLAVVEKARAGEGVAIKLDAGAAVMRFDAADYADDTEVRMVKVTLDGISYDAAPEVANALTKAHAQAADLTAQLAQANITGKGALDKALAERDTYKERLDAAEKRDIRAEVRERVALETTARKILPDVKLDELGNEEIRLAVVKAKFPDLKLDDKSKDYIASRFDIALEEQGRRAADDKRHEEALGEQRGKIVPRQDSSNSADDSIRQMEWRLANQWKPGFDPEGYRRGA